MFKKVKDMDFNTQMYYRRFESNLWWLILIFLGSFIINDSTCIRVLVVIYAIYGFIRQQDVLEYDKQEAIAWELNKYAVHPIWERRENGKHLIVDYKSYGYVLKIKEPDSTQYRTIFTYHDMHDACQALKNYNMFD